MARIADYILNCVIYLYPSLDTAEKGIRVGGSGFIVGVKSNVGDFFYSYAVTNRHVIKKGNSPVIRLNKRDGTFGYIEKKVEDWICHPNGDDLAITPIVINQSEHQVDYYVSDQSFSDREEFKTIDIGIGDEVFIVGRFQLSEGVSQNYPTVRFGYIAKMPVEPLKTPDGIDQESYLVECHSISGFSGSPVFVYVPPFSHRANTETVTTKWQRLFLGVDWGHLPIVEKVQQKNLDKKEWADDPNLRVLNNSAMMGVVPVWKLRELLDEPQFMKQREEEDKKINNPKNQIMKQKGYK